MYVSWSITKADQERVVAFEMWSHQRVRRVPWSTKKTNKWILEKNGEKLRLRTQMAIRKMTNLGHGVCCEVFGIDIIYGSVE